MSLYVAKDKALKRCVWSPGKLIHRRYCTCNSCSCTKYAIVVQIMSTPFFLTIGSVGGLSAITCS